MSARSAGDYYLKVWLFAHGSGFVGAFFKTAETAPR
jgi:hypothetical protein